MTFERDLVRLEDIVRELERDELELDRALRLFEEGIDRLRTAAASLAEAEGRVKFLVEQADGTFDLGDGDT